MQRISDSELEVMKILWELDKATSSQIVEILIEKTDWNQKTIQTLITRLVSKEAISVDKTNKRMYIYTSNIKEDQYKSYINKSLLKKLYNSSVSLMISSFIKDNKLSKDDIKELKDLLDKE